MSPANPHRLPGSGTGGVRPAGLLRGRVNPPNGPISDPFGGAPGGRTGRKWAAETPLPGRGAPLPEWASPAVFGDSEDSLREYWRRVKGWKGCMK